LVYADYIDKLKNHFFAIFFIRDKTDKQFKNDGGLINIDEVTCVETDKLAMACRINIKKYHDKSKGENYLGFVSIKQSNTSDYFLNWIGAEKRENNNEDTKNLLKTLNNMDVPEEDGKPMRRDEFCKKAHDAILSFGKSPVNISTLSATLFGDSSTISKYAEEHDIPLPTEFIHNKKIVDKLIGYHIKADKIELKFPSGYYGEKIKIDIKSSLIIIHSEQMTKTLEDETVQWKI